MTLRILADMAESLGQQRLTVRTEKVTLVTFLDAGIRLLLDSSLEVRINGLYRADKNVCASWVR